MASVRSPLVRKLSTALTRHFPRPDALWLDDEYGIVGVVTSARFERMDSSDRVDLIDAVLRLELTTEERHQVKMIVGVTPEEEAFGEAVPVKRRRRTATS